jgi:uncharacterized protein YqeY
MTLKERIKDDMKTAFKAGDAATRGTLGMLLSVIQNREIEKRAKSGEAELTDDEVVAALGTEIKKRREAAAQYEAAGRADSAQAELAEAAVMQRYLPEQLSEDDVKKLIADAVASSGAAGPKDMGKVMGAISARIKGRFDGARASALVKEALSA